MDKKKKRQRKQVESDDDDMMGDDNIIIDEAMPNIGKKDLNTSGDADIDMDGMIYSDFVFSGLKDSYFHNIKTLIKPLFEFDNVNSSEVTDLILANKEDVGTAIKNEDEDETKNANVDLFGIYSLIPLTYHFNQKGAWTNVSLQIFETIKSKVEKYASSDLDKTNALNILRNSKVGFLITERVINLPQEATPITLDFILKEIGECRADEAYDGKFELDYVIVMSKFVKRTAPSVKSVKKAKFDAGNTEEILHYKFETEHFIKKAVVSVSYKIPYEEMNLDYLENKNEPQYLSIIFMKMGDFAQVVDYINKSK